ncbi:class I SAM-dependent methyltransferase [Streptomyces lavendofoliae]|nr:class I SAM-dependent methyltransferase [Streptomyces lavendofoliae]
MTTPPRRLMEALDRFNAAHPWDHNAHYHRWILRRLPRRFGSALDVGSGAGDLARLLAGRAGRVHGIDADPAITARAREQAPLAGAAPVTFTVARAPAGIPAGGYDVITCVATLHHLPLTGALTAFRRHLAPGGTLVVVGLYRPRSPVEHLLGAVAVPPNAAMGLLRNRGRAAPPAVSPAAPTRPADTSFADVARAARRVLPGARLRRRLFWRYTLVWRQPGTNRRTKRFCQGVSTARRS